MEEEDIHFIDIDIWVKVFKNGPSKICGKQHLKNLKCHKFYLLVLEYLDPFCAFFAMSLSFHKSLENLVLYYLIFVFAN